MLDANSYSRLLRLPTELRLQIWSLVLGGITFEVYCWPSENYSTVATRVLHRQPNFCSLLRICSQVYDEADLLIFKFNTFRIKSQDAFASWLGQLKPRAQRAIAELHLVTWRATHMIEGLRYLPKPLIEDLPLDKLPGLRRIWIEVRWKACRWSARHLTKEYSESDLEAAEDCLKRHILANNAHVRVHFRREAYVTTVVASC